MEIETLMVVAASIGAGLCIGFGAIGTALGVAYAAGSTCEAVAVAPSEASELQRLMLIGQAVAETGAIFALVIAVLLIFRVDSMVASPEAAAALLGSGLCMGLGGFGGGFGAGMPVGSAVLGIAREPHLKGNLTSSMLLGQAL